MALRPFHLAFPVHNLDAACAFWDGTMGCPEGRSSNEWIDFDFFGHQIVAHVVGGWDAPDAGGNAIEMKAFNDLGQLFAKGAEASPT